MAADDDYLLVKPDQKLTCPKCEHEFALSEGFAKRALEKILEKSTEELADRENAIKDDIEKRAKTIATQREKASREEVGELKKLLEEQAKKNKDIVDAAKASERASATAREEELNARLEPAPRRTSRCVSARKRLRRGRGALMHLLRALQLQEQPNSWRQIVRPTSSDWQNEIHK